MGSVQSGYKEVFGSTEELSREQYSRVDESSIRNWQSQNNAKKELSGAKKTSRVI
jgi:hypothetical protein